MNIKLTACAALLAIAAISPASANCYRGDCVGNALGFFGGMFLGAALAPQPQPQIIVIAPSIPQPFPVWGSPPVTYPYTSPPVSERQWYCRASARWYPDVQTCSTPWAR